MNRTVAGITMVLGLGTALVVAQQPQEADTGKAVEAARGKAIDYSRALPDFECTETVERFVTRTPRTELLLSDRLTIGLTFFQQKEDRQLLSVNQRPTQMTYEQLNGATGQGEFGGMLHEIFYPASHTVFHWQGWKNSHGRKLAVYDYNVDLAHSRYSISSTVGDNHNSALVAFHGQVAWDPVTFEVFHLTYGSEEIPRKIAIETVNTTVDYDYVKIAGQRYLLPTRSETTMRERGEQIVNAGLFYQYRKFGASSSIKFRDEK